MEDSTIEIAAVGEVSDQEGEYDTNSGSDIDDDDHDSYPHTTILTRCGLAIRAHFRLALSCSRGGREHSATPGTFCVSRSSNEK